MGYLARTEAYDEAYDNATAIVNGDATESEKKAAYTALRSAYEGLDILKPEAGKFYRFKGKASGKYMNALTNDAKMKLSDDANDAGNIFFLSETSRLLSYKHGTYIKETHTIGAIGEKNGNTISFNPSESGNAGYFTLKTNAGSPYIYDDKNEDEVDCNGSYAANNCEWIAEEVTSLPVTISSVGFTTLYAPVALEIPEGVEAFVGTLNDEETELTLTDVTEQAEGIPAETGVVLRGAAATYDFNITDEMEAVESDFAGNKETVAKDTNYDPYTLQSHNDGVAFKLFTGTNITGFKAYLNLTPTSDAEAKAVGIRFADDTTGIEDTELDVQDAEPIYDLMGRRVEKMVKGNMYIVNGKKVVI